MANRILDLDGLKEMFDEVRRVQGTGSEDLDLIDNIDPDSPLEMDIGGQVKVVNRSMKESREWVTKEAKTRARKSPRRKRN